MRTKMFTRIFRAVLIVIAVIGALMLIDHWGALGFAVTGAAATIVFSVIDKRNVVHKG